ncbi:Hsp20/alpha crystallin family protein [Amycolatopsis thermoflava]|uniref:Hsp20/alpha crystallin family protein n=1 Tax=Amycolatopsis thermoflava TaxID=84480 RepID=UPI00040945BE|nr:Hsp20/alpha crystallin family protein [Amycolatopsis thermoflava]
MALPAVRATSSLGRWDPFRELEDLYTQMGRWMENAFNRVDQGMPVWAPLADVSETEDAYVVEVDLPGVKRDDMAIELVGSELAVTGEIKEKERQGLLRHRTRRTGQFSYRVTLPDRVDAEKIEAALDEGVLTIRVPKSETIKPRRIAIKGK